MGAFAWVTLATNDSYSLGALVLAHSLRRVGTHHDLAVLITPGVTPSMRAKLATVFNLVQEVNVLDSKDQANLAVLQRPELGITFTKLHCWRLTQYEKCVFIDADALVVRNCDELFEREELSAAPDVGWPDCFNSGVFVFRPSQQTFASITTFAASQGSFDGADQGLLNMYFSDWAHKDISKHLPFIYNMCSTATYSYAPAFKQYGENVRIIHFIGATKPWLQYFDTMTGIVQPPPGCSHLQPLLQIWWNIFCDNVHPQLSDVMGGLAGALSKLTLGEARTDEQQAIEDHMRKQNWEQGHIDYMGRDSFDNIMKKINQTLASAPQRQTSPAKETRQPKKSSRKSSEVEAAIEESEVALPVLAAEDKSELNVSEGSSKDICESISSSEVTPSPEIEKQEEIGETDNTSCVQTTILSTDTIEEATKSVPTMKVASVPNVIQQSQDTEIVQETLTKQEIVDIEQTETISPELVKEVHVPQEIKQVVDTEIIQQITESITEASLDPATVPSDLLEPRDVETSTLAQNVATQIVSEATTECPVPIQVAESVLQAEPKESVSEDPRPVVEAVVSSIIPPVQELAASVSETLFEPGQTLPLEPIPHLGQLNGDDPSLNLEAESTSAPSMTSTALISRSPNIVSVVHEFAPRTQEETAQESQPIAEVSQSMVPESQPILPPCQDTQPQAKLGDTSVDTLEDTAALITSAVSLDSPTSQKTKLTVKLPQSEDTEDIPGETQSLMSIQQQIASPEQIQETTSSIEDSTIVSVTPSEECPRRPSRSKDLKIPGTPIVISPTPPTSPPLDAEAAKIVQEESQKQAQTGSVPQAEEETKVETSIQAQPVTSTETQAVASVEQNIESQSETPTEEKTDAQPQSLVESEQKVKKVKKIVKKSSAESDSPSSQESEGSGKKVKKVTKKVVKKSKEGEETEGAVSSDKPKKVVKKVTKTLSSTSLETNKTVPETPPPSTSSEVPIPPKRKTKSTSSSKVADKKTDES